MEFNKFIKILKRIEWKKLFIDLIAVNILIFIWTFILSVMYQNGWIGTNNLFISKNDFWNFYHNISIIIWTLYIVIIVSVIITTEDHKFRYLKTNKEISVDYILIKYEDGTEKKVKKGFIADFTRHQNESEINFEIVHMTGREIKEIIYACKELGFRLGIFEQEEDKKQEGELTVEILM